MKERIIVSVSTIKGTRHFHVGKWLQRGLRGAVISAALATVATGGVIYYLIHQVDFALDRQHELESQSLSLNEELRSLEDLKRELEEDLEERETRLTTVADRLGDLEVILGFSESDDQIESRLDAAAITSAVRVSLLDEIPNGSPTPGARISSHYGTRTHPVTGRKTTHRGMDFAVNTGTPIYAPADGVVETVRPSNEGSGNFLRLQHSFGITTSYSHLDKFEVRSGQFVRKGDLIGRSGNTGLSTGPHLHYEVRFVGRALDPRHFVNWGLDNFETLFEKERNIRWESLVKRVEQRVSSQLQLSSQKGVASKESSS
ncbi:M23 family metallopeptidase [Thaumasiovibrio sp. DFM-14]|uniref:M23 family metallopeptidase n=1 Tax=Thaumasiovibrio sp. DFM-14 TaxID=3384792 RepID=UPI0039A2685C